MPFTISETKRLNEAVMLFEIEAPLIAEGARAGQFVMLRVDKKGERIPLTVVKKDRKRGVITIIFQEAGKTTKKLASLKKGDEISDLTGPLGRQTSFGKAGKVVFVGGGVGVAEILPVIEYAKAHENSITAIIGARTKNFVILEKEIKDAVGAVTVTTDDGTHGRKGFVTDSLKEMLDREKFDLCYCVGPDIMMRAVSNLTKGYGLKTLVSLDANMVDATGMCGTCRVTVGGEIKFTCVDGPEFDGHRVDWDEFLTRQKRFEREEKRSLEKYNHHCGCNKGPGPGQ